MCLYNCVLYMLYILSKDFLFFVTTSMESLYGVKMYFPIISFVFCSRLRCKGVLKSLYSLFGISEMDIYFWCNCIFSYHSINLLLVHVCIACASYTWCPSVMVVCNDYVISFSLLILAMYICCPDYSSKSAKKHKKHS